MLNASNVTHVFLPDSPDGFYPLLGTSFLVFGFILFILVFAAVPAYCMKVVSCRTDCCNCKRCFRRIGTGLKEAFLEEIIVYEEEEGEPIPETKDDADIPKPPEIKK